MKSRYNPVLLAVIVIGLVCALWLNYSRYEIEEKNNTVEMAMEYEGLQQLADWEGLPLDSVLKDFKDAGVTSLIVFDTTLQNSTTKGLFMPFRDVNFCITEPAVRILRLCSSRK